MFPSAAGLITRLISNGTFKPGDTLTLSDEDMFAPLLLQGSEWLIVAVIVVVLIFGANKLPDIAKSLGRASGEFKKGKIEGDKEIEQLKRDTFSSQPSEHEKLLKAAKELGISTEGKTDDQIREEVKKALA